MNLLIGEQKILLNFVINSFKSNTFSQTNSRLIHSKNCFQRNVIKNNCFLRTRSPNVFHKRDINFEKIRRIWRIIRLKDRGVGHNFFKDRIDSKTNILVYKAEVNRICSMGGVVFPFLMIIACIGAELHKLFDKNQSIDPYLKPSFIEKYVFEIIIIVSLFHMSLSKRYVLRIYFNKKRKVFTLSTWRWYLPFRTLKTECLPGSAMESPWFNNSILFDIMFGNTKIGNKRFFINEEHFIFAPFYNVLFGFSPPEDLNKFGQLSDDNHTQVAEQLIKQRAKLSK